MKKIAIFVDGSNFGMALKKAGFAVDYQRIREYFNNFGTIAGSYYFTALPPKHETSHIRHFTNSLQHKGWNIVTKEVKRFTEGDVTKTKGNMDIEIVCKAWRLSAHISDLILFSGDGDFRQMVEQLQDCAVTVRVISHTGFIADELRRQADEYIDITQIRAEVERR